MDYLENNDYQVIWLNSFKHELSHIYYYLSKVLQEPLIANNFHKKVYRVLETLAYFPERYATILSKKGVHRIPIDKYVILYTVNHNTRSSFYFTYFS